MVVVVVIVDIVFVVVVGPRNLNSKFGENRISNRDILKFFLFVFLLLLLLLFFFVVPKVITIF